MQLFLLILALLVAIVAVIFAVQNAASITVSFLVWQFGASLALVLLLAVAVGVLLVMLVTAPGNIRNSWNLSRLKKRVAELETEVQTERTKAATLEANLQEVKSKLETVGKKPEPPASAPAKLA